MAKELILTISPSKSSTLLSVRDAFDQILEMLDILEELEKSQSGIVSVKWMLREAHTNSPPFTLAADASAIEPGDRVDETAQRILSQFHSHLRDFVNSSDFEVPNKKSRDRYKSVTDRLTNGVGETKIEIRGFDPIVITDVDANRIRNNGSFPKSPKKGVSHLEHGSMQVMVEGVAKRQGKSILRVLDRLTNRKIDCEISEDLANDIGLDHQWIEVWKDVFFDLSGMMHYDDDGQLVRVEVESLDELEWSEVTLEEVRALDILQGRTVSEHRALVRRHLDEEP